MQNYLHALFDHVDVGITRWLSRYSIALLRIGRARGRLSLVRHAEVLPESEPGARPGSAHHRYPHLRVGDS